MSFKSTKSFPKGMLPTPFMHTSGCVTPTFLNNRPAPTEGLTKSEARKQQEVRASQRSACGPQLTIPPAAAGSGQTAPQQAHTLQPSMSPAAG